MNKKQVVNQSMARIKYLLEKEYNLKSDKADLAIKRSKIKKIYSQNFEQAAHDPIETWAETVYEYYIKNNL